MTHQPNHHMPPCGCPPMQPVAVGEINYSAEQINQLLALIPLKMDRKELHGLISYTSDNYIGHVPDTTSLKPQKAFAWAFVGELSGASPYFYYTPDFIPEGLEEGWNDMSSFFGKYNMTPSKKEDAISAEELFAGYFRLPTLTADKAIADEQGNRIIDTYVKREAVANHIKETYNKQFTENPPLITKGYITPEMLSEETRQMLEATGQDITNLPDGEDLQSVHGVLKFANKEYNPNSYDGLGRQYIRRNIVNGVNTLVQSMVQWSNTLYIIRYDHDLQGRTITIPEGCTLMFESGKLYNGKVVLNDTQVRPYGCLLKDYIDCQIEGTFRKGQVLYSEQYKQTEVWTGKKWKCSYSVLFRVYGNKLQQSLDDGDTWEDVSDYIASYFRFVASDELNSVGKIQISQDNKTWTDLSPEITNYMRIADYVATTAELPKNAPQGLIYGVGPVDGSTYTLYVNTSKGWINNGSFTSFTAGVVQDTGDNENVVMSQKAVSAKLSELGSKVHYIGAPLGAESFSNMSGAEYKIYANIDLKIGSKISLLANGTAEWDTAWVYYNDDVANKRLLNRVKKGEIYEIEVTQEDIYNVGFCISNLTAAGDVYLSILNRESILSEQIKVLENSIQTKVEQVPLFSNYIDLSRKIEVGWLGKETTVNIKRGTSLCIKYKFTQLTGGGWRLYANDYDHILAGNTSLEGEIVKVVDYDIKRLILYTNAEVEGSADVCIYEINELKEEVSNIQTSIGVTIGPQEFNNTSATEYKILGDVNLKVGSNISLKVEGSAEWDLAWVYYNDDVAKKRLIYKIEKGKTYDLEISEEDIYNIGFCISKLTTAGNVSLSVLNIDTFLAEKVKALENNTSSTIYNGKVGVCMGDSHAQRRSQWVDAVFKGIGATYDVEVTNAIAPNNITGEGYEDYVDAMYAQAVRAVEQYQQGKQIDIILLDNVHYSTTDDPSKLVPFKPASVVNIGNNAAGSSQEQSWFSSNFNSIISNITPKIGTMLKSTWNGIAYELSFSGTPVAGKVFILSIDGESYSTPIEEGDSVSSFVSRLGEWSFNEQKYLVQVNGSVLKLSYIGQESNPTISINYDAGESGLTMTIKEKSELSTVYRYYNSLSTSGWNDISNWTIIWNFDKRCIIGAIEYLIENIPNVVIICVAIPNYRLSKGVFVTQGEFKNSKLYTDGRKRASYLLDVAQLYGLKSIDIEKLWNIALPNWFEFFYENDVHPNANGYKRIADTIITELL